MTPLSLHQGIELTPVTLLSLLLAPTLADPGEASPNRQNPNSRDKTRFDLFYGAVLRPVPHFLAMRPRRRGGGKGGEEARQRAVGGGVEMEAKAE